MKMDQVKDAERRVRLSKKAKPWWKRIFCDHDMEPIGGHEVFHQKSGDRPIVRPEWSDGKTITLRCRKCGGSYRIDDATYKAMLPHVPDVTPPEPVNA